MKAVLIVLVAIAVAVQAVNMANAPIRKPNDRWMTGRTTWVSGWTPFQEKSREEIIRMLGWKKNEARTLPVKEAVPVPELPNNWDSRQQWPNCKTIATITDQARCGSCWAFGAVESISDRFCIQSNGSVNFFLSFQDMVACGPDDGCDGGDAGDAYSYAQSSGLVTAKCYPYTVPTCPPSQEPCMNFVPTPQCTSQCVDNEDWSTSKHYLASAYSVSSDESQIRAEMFAHGPVEACFDVYEDFLSYKSGVYSHQTGDYLGGHCVKCTGWGVDANGNPYWQCNNSWTTTWGDNGGFKILRGSDECGIEDDVVAGIPNVSSQSK